MEEKCNIFFLYFLAFIPVLMTINSDVFTYQMIMFFDDVINSYNNQVRYHSKKDKKNILVTQRNLQTHIKKSLEMINLKQDFWVELEMVIKDSKLGEEFADKAIQKLLPYIKTCVGNYYRKALSYG